MYWFVIFRKRFVLLFESGNDGVFYFSVKRGEMWWCIWCDCGCCFDWCGGVIWFCGRDYCFINGNDVRWNGGIYVVRWGGINVD